MMEGSQGGSNAPAPFLTKTYEMIDDPLTNSVVSWSPSAQSFVVWNPPEFARDLLPKYFKHNNFSSFIRQLNTYGFKKIDPEQWEFANEDFIRGQMHLLKNIHRRKPIHSHSGQGNGAVALTDSEREEFEKEIERLKSDQNLLQLELQRHKQEYQEYESGMRSLGQSVLNIAERRRQLISCFGQLLQKPEFPPSVLQHSETPSKKRRLLVSNYLCNEANKRDEQIMTFHEDNENASSVPMINLELVETLDSCLGFWENFIQELNQTRVDEVTDFGMLPQPQPVIITEMRASSTDSDLNVQLCSVQPHHSSSSSKDICSSPELSGSSNRVESPVISSIYLNIDSRAKSSRIDVNTRPENALDIDASKDRAASSTSPATPPGANDVFWQQFLTETPGSSDTQDVQAERNDIDCRRSRPWWNMSNVDSLAKQMEHLTPAERT